MMNTIIELATDSHDGSNDDRNDDSNDGDVRAISTAVIYWPLLPDHPAPVAVQTDYYVSICTETEAGWRFRRRETHMSGIFHPRDVYAAE